MIRILIVDDHPLVRDGIRQTVAMAPDLVIGGEASDVASALCRLEEETWDIVLLDLSLPGRSGFELLLDIVRRWPLVRVLIFSVHDERAVVLRTLRAGAAGYLTKDSGADELLRALRQVAAGGKYVTAAIATELVDEVCEGKQHLALHETLSHREYEVLCRLALGHPIRDIARQLSLSESTVSTYRARLLEKLRLQNTAELVRYVLEHRVDLSPGSRAV